MRTTFIGAIRIYQRVFSPDKGPLRHFFPRNTCTMFPTCSDYMVCTIEKYGTTRGIYKGVLRIFRCHPWQKNIVDLP